VPLSRNFAMEYVPPHEEKHQCTKCGKEFNISGAIEVSC